MKCSKCKSNWDEEYMSELILVHPNQQLKEKKENYNKTMLCQDCRSYLWHQYFT